MCRCSTQPSALRPHVEIFTKAVVVFALAWLEKKKKKNNNNNIQKMNILASWQLTTLAKLSVDVSDVLRLRGTDL